MARRVFTVDHTWAIRGRGVVLFPGLLPIEDERFRVGDTLLLRRPTGEAIRATIGGLELFSGPDVPVLLTGLTKDDVPLGTDVWSVDGEPACG